MLLEAEAGGFPLAPAPDVYVVAAGDDARLPAALLAVRLRRAGLSVHTDLLRRSVKGQMKEADRLRSRYVVTLGDDELKAGTVQIKNMADGSQTSIAQSDIVTVLAPTP
jgi:histidyl-tRNA synthetase